MGKYSPLKGSDMEQMAASGVVVCLKEKGRRVPENADIIYPYFILTLNLSGLAHSLYDKQDLRSQKNDLTVFLPDHIIRPLEATDDYMQAWLIFDPAMFADSELKFTKENLELLYQAPLIHLTDEQSENILTIAGVIQYIVSRTEEELPNKHRLLEAQLTLAYELYMAIRRQYDLVWEKNRIGPVYLRFCDLVTAHYKEEHNVNYYAKQLGYNPRYFSKIFREFNNGISALEWIQSYIVTQAKRIMDQHPDQPVKVTAFQLGFPTSANFCRYFKRATGMTPLEYQKTKKDN